MNIIETNLPGVLILEPKIFSDERGYFLESWHSKFYEKAEIPARFVQDNISLSKKGVLRGLHYQYPRSQGKLIQVLWGEVLDVAVDIRAGSPTYGRWIREILSETNHKQMYIPPGFAHGYYVTSETAIFAYKCTEFYDSAAEHGIIWNDPELNIDWPVKKPILSAKDKNYTRLKDISPEALPHFGEI